MDLGEVEGPVAVFGGPYSNLPALEAFITATEGMTRICTGDVVAYGPHPAETVARVRSLGCPVVMGNVEESLGAGAGDCGCGFEEGSVCDALSAAWFAHADRAIGAEDRMWMARLPRALTFRHEGRRYGVVHAAASSINRFLWSTDTDATLAAEIDLFEAEHGEIDALITGHSGVGFVRDLGGRQWINAGVIGMPPHDGQPTTEYLTLGPPRLHRLAYDHQGAARAMEAAGLTQGYHQALRTGWWPSEDVLPRTLRRAACAPAAAGA